MSQENQENQKLNRLCSKVLILMMEYVNNFPTAKYFGKLFSNFPDLIVEFDKF